MPGSFFKRDRHSGFCKESGQFFLILMYLKRSAVILQPLKASAAFVVSPHQLFQSYVVIAQVYALISVLFFSKLMTHKRRVDNY